MIPFLFIGGGLYFLFDALGNQRPSVDPADLGLPTKGFRGYRKGGHYARGGMLKYGVTEKPDGGYSLKAFEELKKYISCKGFCNEEQELHITQSRETENPSSPNYKQIFAGIRDWGEWEKDEDNNDMVLTKGSIKRLNDIISIIKKRYPVNILWDMEEKNWLSFQIKEEVYKNGGKTPKFKEFQRVRDIKGNYDFSSGTVHSIIPPDSSYGITEFQYGVKFDGQQDEHSLMESELVSE